MSVAKVLFETVVAAYQTAGGTIPLWFGIAAGTRRPFGVLLIVPTNSETPTTFSGDEGEGGSLQCQWSIADDSSLRAYDEAELLKTVVQQTLGIIGTAPNQYRIYGNTTEGVTQGDAGLGGWSSIFESTILWDKEQP